LIADASVLPVRPGSVDAVVLADVLFHLRHPELALREVASALRVGRRLGTVTWGRDWPSRASVLFDSWLDELSVPALGPTGCHDGLSTPGDIAALLGTSGFRCRRAWVEPVGVTFRASRSPGCASPMVEAPLASPSSPRRDVDRSPQSCASASRG
jgi:hypothetical protein